MSFYRFGVWRPAGLLAGLVLGMINAGPSWAQGCETVDSDRCTQTLSTGIEVSYIEVGPEDGPAVILIHGLTDNMRSWATTMASLHELDPELRIMAVDLRGHGRSGMPDAKECAPAPENCSALRISPRISSPSCRRRESPKRARRPFAWLIHRSGSRTDSPEMVTHAVLDATAATGVGNVALADYVLKEPVEGSWKTAIEASGKTYPTDFYTLTPMDADPEVIEWLAETGLSIHQPT